MHTTIYGCIEEMDFWKDPIRTRVSKHNARVIRSLPLADPWPPLSKEMFSICANSKQPGPTLTYGGRIIHFGVNLKSVEYEWHEWRDKFEKLLFKLFFTTAYVHIQTEYMELMSVRWDTDLFKCNIVHDGSMPTPILPDYVTYEGCDLDTMFKKT